MKIQTSVWVGLLAFTVAMFLTACGGGGGNTVVAPDFEGGSSVAAITTDIPAGDARCPSGGVSIDIGIDDNGNGTLDANEVEDTKVVCNGLSGDTGQTALVKVTDEPANTNCPSGGLKLESGLDSNLDNVLAVDEITTTSYVCNGLNATNGVTALLTQTPEPAGAHCTNGGVRIDSGLDSNTNGTLDSAEITSTTYTCNVCQWH